MPKRHAKRSKPARPTKAVSKKKPRTHASNERAASPSIARTCALIETYSATIQGVPALSLRRFALKASSSAAIASLERRLGVELAGDVKAFLSRGLKSVEGSIEEPFATVGFDFLDAKRIVEHTQMLRDVVADGEDDEHTRLIRHAVALTYTEPELVVATDGVYHFSYRNTLLKIAGSFSEFLEHYLAAGCFSSHHFPTLWKVVAPHVPVDIPPAKNVWVRAYRKKFPNFWEA